MSTSLALEGVLSAEIISRSNVAREMRAQPSVASVSTALLQSLYRGMLRIRLIEEAIAERYREQEMRCPVHLSIGQEAAAVGACAALTRADKIVSTHRCHGHYLAKGGSLHAMLAELYGRASGCCGGRGGSMHLFDDVAGVLASVPIVGSSIPLGVGAALHFRQHGEHNVSVVFLGDGSLEEGVFHESANLAALHSLPVIFFVENNLYSVYTRLDERQPDRPLSRLGEAHAIPVREADGNDVVDVYRVVREAAELARHGGGPTMIIADTYRHREHCGPNCDDELGYRPAEEIARFQARCPVRRLREHLERDGTWSESDEKGLRQGVERELKEAFDFARAAPFPEAASVADRVYRALSVTLVVPNRTVDTASPARAPRILNAAQAIREACVQAMRADPAILVMGEGVTDPKAIFGTTAGLVAEFGKNRVMEMPLAENGFTGVAVGAALMGSRPIVIHQRVEFGLLAFEQLANNAGKMHYVSNGAHSVPLVVRLIVGRGWGQGPAHSQSLEALFSYIPGLKVVMPATAADAKGLLLGAIFDDNPVIFIEHRWAHYASGDVPEAMTLDPLDGPRRIRRGKDVTVVSSSYMTLEAMQAADVLARHGCDVDLIDLRVLSPLRLDLVYESVEQTRRLVVVDTGYLDFGIGAEICARVTEQCWTRLQKAPKRIGLPAHPTPSSPSLAAAYYPRSPQIAESIGRIVGLEEAELRAVQGELVALRDRLPCDVPNPSFTGPF